MTISSIKNLARKVLPWPLYRTLKRFREESRAFISRRDLTSLAKIYQTDKWGKHFYTPVYDHWFRDLRFKPIRLLEIGIGGYAKPRQGGNSLRMWKHYFPQGIITGIDIHDKTELAEKRIHIYTGDQSDADFLKKVTVLEGPFDIIVDDGSHMQSHIITSFEALFPLMKPGGMYVIEDTQTSYWPKFEGSTKEMETAPTAMNYFISRIHLVNKSEWIKEDLEKEYTSDDFAAISFYHNLIFITKK
ncbi:MAG TPA: class I SAM-dependent methyltransferase [Saprospiraceae bacterium]|nr:class I SAM-dependent methyltransferase [Saprospiraceae bacterium]